MVNAESSFRLKDMTLYALGSGLCVLIVFSAGTSSYAEFPSRLGASVSLAFGASLVGTLLGFLFGIPRTHQQDVQAKIDKPPTNGDLVYQINTNLEQISDWLTKIIIGVGLIQLGSIGNWLWNFSVNTGNGFIPSSPLAHVYVLGISLYFFISGFLFGYLWTRLFFGIAVRQADENLVGRIEKWEAELRADALAISLVTRQLNLASGEASVPENELQSAVIKSSSHTRSRLFYDALAVRRNDERRELSIPVFIALIKSDTAKVYHQNHAQLAYALKDKANPDWAEAERLLTEAIEIRDRRGEDGGREYEFNRAVCKIRLERPAAEIADDFRRAAEDEWVRTWSVGRWSAWLKANNLTAQGLGFETV